MEEKSEENQGEETEDNEDTSQENELIKNIKNFNASAKLIYDRKDYTSACILYFKATFTILDLVIFRDKGFIPKDHSERFRILEKDYLEFYTFLDKNFPIYQNSYQKVLEFLWGGFWTLKNAKMLRAFLT